eukprot:TRINITY_DN6776_c0_g2_i2.p1 TRINITY_DN6776_c0_g2~~TRINITY_DN6776_c0_g2_i2.p1  ORF type:complete len:427 (+),score=160.29 TRINITY_DN6776_c0_g2_i2:158-1438(+)
MRRTFGLLAVILAASIALTLGFKIRALPASLQSRPLERQLKKLIGKGTTELELVETLNKGMLAAKPQAEVFALFERLIAEVNQEQVSADELQEDQEKDCEAEIEYRSGNIHEAQVTIGRAQEAKGSCDVSLIKNENILAINLQVQQNKDRELSSLKEIREQQHTLFLERRENHDFILEVIEGAYALVKKLEKPKQEANATETTTNVTTETVTNVTETNETATTVTETVTTENQTLNVTEVQNVTAGLLHIYTIARRPLVDALIKHMTSLLARPHDERTVDPEDVEKLHDLLDQLKRSIEDEFRRYTVEEEDGVSAYIAQVHDIQGLLAELSAQEANVKRFIAEFHTCIEENVIILDSETTRLRRNSLLLEAAQRMCASFQEEYKISSASRASSIQLYNKLLEWIREYFKQNKDASAEGLQGAAQNS